MNRWGVVILALFTAFHVCSSALMSGTTWRAPVAAFVLGALVLVPAALYWNRMVWRRDEPLAVG